MTWPNSRAFIVRQIGDLDPEKQKRVLSQNCIDLYGLDIKCDMFPREVTRARATGRFVTHVRTQPKPPIGTTFATVELVMVYIIHLSHPFG